MLAKSEKDYRRNKIQGMKFDDVIMYKFILIFFYPMGCLYMPYRREGRVEKGMREGKIVLWEFEHVYSQFMSHYLTDWVDSRGTIHQEYY